MPDGYRTRVAPEYLTKVYSHPTRTGKQYAEDYLAAHGLKDCTAAQRMVDALTLIDQMFLVDRIKGAINLVSLEKLARIALGYGLGFQKCSEESHWRKPKNAPKTWASKVDFEIMKRVDPGNLADFGTVEFLKELKAEVKGEMTKDAELAKVKNKLAERVIADDFLNL